MGSAVQSGWGRKRGLLVAGGEEDWSVCYQLWSECGAWWCWVSLGSSVGQLVGREVLGATRRSCVIMWCVVLYECNLCHNINTKYMTIVQYIYMLIDSC